MRHKCQDCYSLFLKGRWTTYCYRPDETEIKEINHTLSSKERNNLSFQPVQANSIPLEGAAFSSICRYICYRGIWDSNIYKHNIEGFREQLTTELECEYFTPFSENISSATPEAVEGLLQIQETMSAEKKVDQNRRLGYLISFLSGIAVGVITTIITNKFFPS